MGFNVSDQGVVECHQSFEINLGKVKYNLRWKLTKSPFKERKETPFEYQFKPAKRKKKKKKRKKKKGL
jgi:hypothetical protein